MSLNSNEKKDKLNDNFNNVENDAEDEEKYYCEEEELVFEADDDFSFQIKERGNDYYKSGNIIYLYKDNHKYYAKVRGSGNNIYDVSIEIKEDCIEYNCTCPCDYPCKHEYAVIRAINNGEYSSVKLKPFINEKKDSLQNIIIKIPADEIKDYLLSPEGLNYVCFEMGAFEKHFRKYYPNQSYEYYYNNLYNMLKLGVDYQTEVSTDINKIRQYISSNDFKEAFKILKSIIEAYNDAERLNNDEFIINEFANLGILFRIICRKSNEKLEKNIKSWINDLRNKNYYNNLYLEDMVETSKFAINTLKKDDSKN